MSEELEPKRSQLHARVQAVDAFLTIADRLFEIRSLGWSTVEDDLRLLAVNAAFRRQLESVKAAVLLARQDLGHLAVAFVRAALEDVIYLKFFFNLDQPAAQRLFLLLGRWDGLRSLLSQRAYVGDDVMNQLWYSTEFLDAAETQHNVTRDALRRLQREYGWSGGLVPSAAWLADRAGLRPLYDYLHAATSRALHFSAGEIMRSGWGDPSGEMRTDEVGFREHVADFALHQLVLLFFETWNIMSDIAEAGISLAEDIPSAEVDTAVQRIAALGQVPLVHAAEWNLRPGGPAPMTPRG